MIMKRGFTLIELLVVITIMAILAGAALPYVQAYVSESKISKAKADLDEIGRALAVYETREGDYNASDVSQLTGRYLNKAPIDPWGKSYAIATGAGMVYSSGPDRDYTTEEDNISYPYQPPLSLVQAKWVDVNQSGAVDNQNASDQIQLIFSRKVQTATGAINTDGWKKNFGIGLSDITTVFWTPSALWTTSSKTLIIDVWKKDGFVPGSDSVQINGPDILKDMNGSICISSQTCVILPQ